MALTIGHKFCKWIPTLCCKNNEEPQKIKDLNISRGDFATREEKKRPLVAIPKEKFNPVIKSYYHFLM